MNAPALFPTPPAADCLGATPRPLPACSVPWADLLRHRSDLVRFAQRKLHDPMLAEDVVHDVYEAVLSGRASFGGRSALRSWLTGILKHKIVDLVRQRAGTDSLEDQAIDGSAMDVECAQPRPEDRLDQRQQLALALERIDALPAGLRDALRLRVVHDQSSEAVCSALSITPENLFVRLHRARKQLVS